MELEEQYKKYLEWRARPRKSKSATEKETVDDYCVREKVSRETLLTFTERESFPDDLLAETLKWARVKTPELLHTVYATIEKNKSVADLERWMMLVNEFKKKKDEKGQQYNQYNFFTNLDDERYKKIAIREAGLLGEGGTK